VLHDRGERGGALAVAGGALAVARPARRRHGLPSAGPGLQIAAPFIDDYLDFSSLGSLVELVANVEETPVPTGASAVMATGSHSY
jgi:hypothetical protein